MDLPKPHNLNNQAYLRAILETALDLLEKSPTSEPNPYSLAQKVCQELGLSSSEAAMISNGIAPKFAPKVSREYIEKSLAKLPTVASTPVPSDPPKQVAEAAPPIETKYGVEDVKKKMLEILAEKRIVTSNYLAKIIQKDLAKANCSLKNLEMHCLSNEAVWANLGDLTFVALPGINASKETLVQQLLEEQGHKPFGITRLAERFAMQADETERWLKNRKFGSLILWSPYDVWSIGDIRIDETRAQEIRRFVKSRRQKPILLDDAFNWVVRGVVARNLYQEIYVDSKVSAVDKAFNLAGVHDYQYDKQTKRYVCKDKKTETVQKPEPLYKPLWEEI